MDREHAPTTVGLLLSILMLIGALILMLMPKPTPFDAKTWNRSMLKARTVEVTAESANKNVLDQIAGQTWGGSTDQIAPSALAFVTQVAAKHNVQLESFRPQRVVNTGDVTQMGYLINVSGGFPDVSAFEKDIEDPSSRLAIETVQLGSSDESTDNVAGTVGVEAYVLTPHTTTSTKTTTTIKAKPAAKGGNVGKA
jgi:Tfp pilus assembly protein PilO